MALVLSKDGLSWINLENVIVTISRAIDNYKKTRSTLHRPFLAIFRQQRNTSPRYFFNIIYSLPIVYSSFSFDFVCWFPWSRAEQQRLAEPKIDLEMNQSSRSFSQSHVIVRTVPCRDVVTTCFHAWPPTGIHCFVFYSKEGGEEISKINFFFFFLKEKQQAGRRVF